MGDKAVAVNDFAFVIGHRDLAPVDLQGILAFGQGDAVGIAVDLGVKMSSHFDPGLN